MTSRWFAIARRTGIAGRSGGRLLVLAVWLASAAASSLWAAEPPDSTTPATESTPAADTPAAPDADAESDGRLAPLQRLRDRRVNRQAVEPVRDVVYSEETGVRLTADVYVPDGDGPFPGVLVVHGGAWRSGSPLQMGHISQRLARDGYVAVSIRYRLAPEFKFPAQIHDCKAALRWMRSHADEYKIDPERIGAWGYSAGAHLVALLATTDPTAGLEGPNVPADAPSTRVKAVVAGGTPCDFRLLPEDALAMAFLFGGSRREVPKIYEQASPAAYVSADDPPMFLYHGSADHLVPLRNAERMALLLKQAGVPCELRILPEAGHLQAMFNSNAARDAVKFLDEHLKVSAPDASPATGATTASSPEPSHND
ncbi:MAG: alpha/beta hydrolase fold domain-containing protein [Pirellulales bacterium]